VRVLIAPFPATPPTQRISFVVEQRGERAFILSATTAQVPFTAIPQGTSRLRASGDGVVADGFFGPSGGGDEIAYLRWRVAGVTYELFAVLSASLTHRDVQAITIAMIDAGFTDAAAGAG